MSSLVLFEWRRGPRIEADLALEAVILGPDAVAGFGELEARVAADVSRQVRRPRGRELDIAVAACALTQNASFWTLNRDDFDDIPGLHLHIP